MYFTDCLLIFSAVYQFYSFFYLNAFDMKILAVFFLLLIAKIDLPSIYFYFVDLKIALAKIKKIAEKLEIVEFIEIKEKLCIKIIRTGFLVETDYIDCSSPSGSIKIGNKYYAKPTAQTVDSGDMIF